MVKPNKRAIVDNGVMKTRCKHIIQVFHNHIIYGKAEHRAASRRQEISLWNSIIDSSTGYAEGETLILHESIKEQQNDFDNCDLLILNDYNRESARQFSRKRYTNNYTFIRFFVHPQPFEIFRLACGEQHIELFLDYSHNSYYIGIPKRDDFKVANLRLNYPIRISLNGKTDTTVSGSPRARTYKLFEYVFLYIGKFKQFQLVPSKVQKFKHIPLTEAKHINLTKILY